MKMNISMDQMFTAPNILMIGGTGSGRAKRTSQIIEGWTKQFGDLVDVLVIDRNKNALDYDKLFKKGSATKVIHELDIDEVAINAKISSAIYSIYNELMARMDKLSKVGMNNLKSYEKSCGKEEKRIVIVLDIKPPA